MWFVDTAEFWLQLDEPGEFPYPPPRCGVTSSQVGSSPSLCSLFPGSASQQIRRAHVLVNDIKHDMPALVRFKTAQARCLDNERKFLDASMRYLELSQMVLPVAPLLSTPRALATPTVSEFLTCMPYHRLVELKSKTVLS